MNNEQLIISNIHASIDEKEILHGVSFRVNPGEVHVIMGPNGSGKSTLASVLLGHPGYQILNPKPKSGTFKSTIKIGKNDLTNLATEERARAGLFLAFQSPIAIPGVSVMSLLKTAYDEMHKTEQKDVPAQGRLAKRFQVGGMGIGEFMDLVKEFAKELSLDTVLLERGIHEGFSGGEKKKVEMLQALVLAPKFAVFDEIDTGLDVDALRAVAAGIDTLRKNGTGLVIITHYQRILNYIQPDVVHILVKGNIVKSGSGELVKQIEEHGYKGFI